MTDAGGSPGVLNEHELYRENTCSEVVEVDAGYDYALSVFLRIGPTNIIPVFEKCKKIPVFHLVFNSTSPKTGCPTQVSISPSSSSLSVSTSLFDIHTLPAISLSAQLPQRPVSQL